GYAFAGWYTNSTCTSPYSFSGNITSSDTTLYAKWIAMSSSYSTREYVDIVNYNNSSSMKSFTVSATSSTSQNYYYFTCYKAGTFTINASLTSGDYYITAHNVSKGVTILNRYNMYGSCPSQSVTFTADAGDVIYVSLYKYSSSGSTGYGSFYVSGASYPTSTSVAIMNIWNDDLSDYIYSEGASATNTVTYGTSVTLPTPSRTGYTFLGWYNGEDKVESGVWSIASVVTLEPKWQSNSYTVTLDVSGGSAVTPTEFTLCYGDSFTLPTPTRAGYTFLGWYYGDDKVEGTTWNIDNGSAIALLARWDEDAYSVSYDLAGGTNGTGNPDSYTVNRGFTLTAPSKHGYTFLGWTYEGQTTPVVEVTVPVGTIGNKSYTANWQANTYTLTLDANGGSVSPTSLNVTYGSSYTLPTPTHSSGYMFMGWYDENTLVNSGVWNRNSGVTLVAKWEIYTRNGNYIYFGEYPQTIKAAGVTVTSTTDSRGYYLGSDGCYYARVTASPYGSGYTFSTGATVTSGTVYYFKVEPIRWRILSEDGDSAFILCDSIIATKVYESAGDNNYKDSDIRAWLNATFYETAFSELQREIILTTTVTGYSEDSYFCEDTDDKIFLLSNLEMTNTAFGFSSSYSDYDTARRMSTSDYSRATGVQMSTDSSYYGIGYYCWLRPNSRTGFPVNTWGTFLDGFIADYLGVDNGGVGVVPALNIRL
ncbi:MAG: InlB B-repeat-containing protein, partial [Clostridia bacterium]|nr:InlB B-repeat-containing protein [Clostridia bacterium]